MARRRLANGGIRQAVKRNRGVSSRRKIARHRGKHRARKSNDNGLLAAAGGERKAAAAASAAGDDESTLGTALMAPVTASAAGDRWRSLSLWHRKINRRRKITAGGGGGSWRWQSGASSGEAKMKISGGENGINNVATAAQHPAGGAAAAKRDEQWRHGWRQLALEKRNISNVSAW
jgi:hypothetical protein